MADAPVPNVPHEYIRPPEWVSVNECGSPLVAKRMFGKVVAQRPPATAFVSDQPEG